VADRSPRAHWGAADDHRPPGRRAVLRCGHRRGEAGFLAGQGRIRNGTPVCGSIAEQTQVTLRGIAGYLELFEGYRPARTIVQATLIGGIGVEITR
jgi:hypothetical protein